MRAATLALVLAVLTAALPRVAATQCADWSRQPTILPALGGEFLRAGTLVYVLGQGPRLAVVDMADPLRPVEVASVPASPGTSHIDADGSWLYASTPAGVDIYDLSDPLAPTLATTIVTPWAVVDVAVDGAAMWALSSSELNSYDVTDPLAGVLVHTEPAPVDTSGPGYFTTFQRVSKVPGVPGQILVRQRTTDGTGGDGVSLYRVDVTVPTSPVFSGFIGIASDQQFGYGAVYTAVSGSLAISAADVFDGGGESAEFDSRDVAQLHLPAGKLNLGYGTRGVGVGFQGSSTALWSVRSGGAFSLRIIDLTDPTAPVETGSIPVPFAFGRMDAQGDHLLGTALGLTALDLSGASPDFLSPLGTLARTGRTWDMDLDAGIAWMAEGADLTLVDVSNPAAPQLLGSLAGAGSYQVEAAGSTGWTTWSRDFSIVDATDPMNPAVTGVFSTGSDYLYGFEVENGFAHVATSTGYLRLNVTNPAAPTPAGFLSLGKQGLDVALWDGFIYVTTDSGTVEMLDVFQAPRHRHTFTQIAGVPEKIVARDGLGYVAADGLFILSLPPGGGNPPPPTLLGQIPLPLCDELTLAGDVAYLSRSAINVTYAVDISDPANPALISVLPSAGGPSAVSNDVVWIAPGAFSLTVPYALRALPAHCASAVTAPIVPPAGSLRLTAAPNPTRGGADVRFSIRGPERVRLTVHDVAGRLVATLTEGPAVAGEHSAAWNGRGTAGAIVPAGVYFVRLEAGGKQESRRVVVLR